MDQPIQAMKKKTNNETLPNEKEDWTTPYTMQNVSQRTNQGEEESCTKTSCNVITRKWRSLFEEEGEKSERHTVMERPQAGSKSMPLSQLPVTLDSKEKILMEGNGS